MFKITQGKGFHITFDNGYTVSAQFGYDDKCENRLKCVMSTSSAPNAPGSERHKRILESADCDVAIWDKDNVWVTPEIMEMLNIESHDIGSKYPSQGFVTANEFAKIVACVANLV